MDITRYNHAYKPPRTGYCVYSIYIYPLITRTALPSSLVEQIWVAIRGFCRLCYIRTTCTLITCCKCLNKQEFINGLGFPNLQGVGSGLSRTIGTQLSKAAAGPLSCFLHIFAPSLHNTNTDRAIRQHWNLECVHKSQKGSKHSTGKVDELLC